MPGSENGRSVVFSPDGEWVAYFGFRALYKAAVRGGAPVELSAITGQPMGATWADDGTIIFSVATVSGMRAGLIGISADGGTPQQLTTPDTASGEVDHRTPHFVSGSDVVLYTSWPSTGGLGEARIGVLSLETGETTLLGRGFHPRYAETGHLVFAQAGGSIVAQAFDIESRTVSGPLIYLADSVFTATGGWADYDISSTGTLLYLQDLLVV